MNWLKLELGLEYIYPPKFMKICQIEILFEHNKIKVEIFMKTQKSEFYFDLPKIKSKSTFSHTQISQLLSKWENIDEKCVRMDLSELGLTCFWFYEIFGLISFSDFWYFRIRPFAALWAFRTSNILLYHILLKKLLTVTGRFS